jgi:hypothetical protein
MSKLPQVSGSDVVRALEKVGFTVRRQHGSHIIMRARRAIRTDGLFPITDRLIAAPCGRFSVRPRSAQTNSSKLL